MKKKSIAQTTRHKQLVFSCVLLLSSIGTATASDAFSLAGNVGYVSDYAFRGISQTDEGMALQGGLTLNHSSGFYLSSWGSNIDFGQGSMELDLLLGWTGDLTAGWKTDIGVMQYRYPNGDSDIDQFNFVEWYAKAIYQDLTLGLAYSSDYFGTDVEGYYYLSADYNYPLHELFSLQFHLSLNQFDNNDEFATFLAAGPVSTDRYLDWSLGASTSVLGSTVSLKWVGTDIDASADCYLCDDRAVLSISKSF